MAHENLAQMFFAVAERFPQKDGYQYKKDGQYTGISFQDAADRIKHIASGLVALGVKRGEKVAIISPNSLEWALSDYAILALGAITVPIYPSLLANQAAYILKDSETVAVICSDLEQYKKVIKSKDNCPMLHSIVVVDAPPSNGTYLTFAELIAKGEEYISGNPHYVMEQCNLQKRSDLATIIYTSGTTGEPKGVMLTHGNILSNIEGSLQHIEVTEQDTLLSFLPLSHVFERMAGHYLATSCGATVAYAESIDTVAANMAEVRPTVMTSVPRLYEKIYARILENVEGGPPLKRKIFYWAIEVGKEYVTHIMNKQKITKPLALKRALAYKLVFAKLAQRVGGRLRFFVSGGAPLAKEIAEFFAAAGLKILEGYGLTETSPVIAVNKEDHFRLGTVGPPIPNVEVKIADDGEILTRGPHVMTGYYKKEEETFEVIDPEGWCHTGDIGFIDDDGFLTITDRKKNIIVTSGGKNIAPQSIENQLIQSKYIEHAMIVGDKRKFCCAVIVPAFEALNGWVEANNLSFDTPGQMVTAPEVRELLRNEVDAVNQNMASYETIKDFVISPQVFSIETGELTPSLKVKRRVVLEKFKDEIEHLYAANGNG
jgi:long-chain acyl-CoA synthetase